MFLWGKDLQNATRLDEEKVTKAIKQEFPYASIIWLKEFAKAICTAHSKGELIADEELTGEPFPSVDEIEDENRFGLKNISGTSLVCWRKEFC